MATRISHIFFRALAGTAFIVGGMSAQAQIFPRAVHFDDGPARHVAPGPGRETFGSASAKLAALGMGRHLGGFAAQAGPVPFFVVDRDNRLIEPGGTSPGTALYDRRSFEAKTGNAQPPVPVTAPDGHHLTWGEWRDVHGFLFASCNRNGTQVTALLTGLIPHGVYTLWNVVFEAPGFNGQFTAEGTTDNLTGVGPAGPANGNLSSFHASATGTALVSVTTPPGNLGTVGSLGKCAPRDEYEWHVVGLYHFDNRTHGSLLGPAGTMAEQFAFVFK